jgi:homoserine kinase type II
MTAVRVRRPERGTNNDVRLIETPAGSFVWRAYDNLTVTQVRTEHRLLDWLAARELPVQFPRPIRTISGATFVELPDGRAAGLHRLIPGRRPGACEDEIRHTARAFATVLAALADAPRRFAIRDWTKTRLEEIHEGIGDPEQLLNELARYDVDLGWLKEALTDQDEVQRALYALPQQIVHGDVAQSNALTDGRRITGLLDWEISGWDARVSDVGTALLALGSDPDSERGRTRIRLVLNEFRVALELSPAEVGILPEVVRQRVAGSVFWRAARWRMGHGDVAAVLHHVRDGGMTLQQLEAYSARPTT